ncbi:MAG: ABC transporter permease subunit [Thermotogae bacterium]|nr:ABC transporter permease subunit [Thermotogota bacterium]
MNVYKWDLKRYIKGVLAWSTVLILLQFMYASFYPSFAEDTELITKWMKIMPRAFVKLFGLEDLDFSNILNYLAMVSSIYVTLVGSVFASLVGVRSISREEDEKTAEFLLSKPVSREKIVISKFLSSLTQVLIFDGIVSLASLGFLNIYKQGDFDVTKFWLFWFSQIVLHLTIMNISFLIGAVLKKIEGALPLSLGTMFVLYVVNMISKLTEEAEFLKYFTPFSYSDPAVVMKSGLSASYLYFYVFVNIVLFTVSALRYSKKDILV